MTDFDQQIQEAFDAEARSAPGPHDARLVIAKTRRRQGLTLATGVLAVGGFVVASLLGLRAVGAFDRGAPPAGPPATKAPVPALPATATQIASGHGWRLLADQGKGFCFYLVGRHLNDRSCNYVSPPSGSANVDSLGSQGALFYGTVSTRAARMEVRPGDGSLVMAHVFPPPRTLAIKRKLFVAELQGPRGRATVEIWDKRGERLAIGEFRWAEGEGTGFAFSAV